MSFRVKCNITMKIESMLIISLGSEGQGHTPWLDVVIFYPLWRSSGWGFLWLTEGLEFLFVILNWCLLQAYWTPLLSLKCCNKIYHTGYKQTKSSHNGSKDEA